MAGPKVVFLARVNGPQAIIGGREPTSRRAPSEDRSIAVSGRLEETGVPGLLQVFSQGRRTGRLVFSNAESQAILVLRDGALVYAASSSVRETLGNALVSRGILDTATLAEGLRRQHESRRSVRLGSVLEEMGAATRDQIMDVVRSQALGVLKEIVGWTSGFFKFEKLDLEDEGELPVDLNDFLIEEGLRVDQALIDIAFDDDEEGEEAAPRGPRVSLREVVGQVSHASINAEVTQGLLQFASAFLERVVLFLVKGGTLEGIAQAGLAEGAEAQVRTLTFDVAASPLFREVAEEQTSRCTPVKEGTLAPLLPVLGEAPRHALVCPLVVNGEVTLVLYGDARNGDITNADLLEAVMLQTGLAMEKAILEQRVAELEKQLEEQQTAQVQTPQEQTGRVSLESGTLSTPGSGTGIAESSQRIADLLAGRTSG